ncbi:MAG: prepilin peptidase [Micavibrio aeruginosavorus]|uniref:Prepilin peptidase n=1 Tax=Micavibrio aeruginosavorus TaxID=349221 RepID=A0A2W4ZZJ1_9BACT|nr:MAG: prepilin peptidase [Micavibrio aeruginosavorus]
MIEYIPLFCLAASIVLLVWMSLIDLKHWILPDELNAALGITGIIFHVTTAYRFVDMEGMLAGAAIGAGLLLLIRFFANRHYGRDALGLGDVKLLGAAGLWLGFEGTINALTLGAFAGLLHGVAYAAFLSVKTRSPFTIRELAIPAGPGFAIGIAGVGAWMYHGYVMETVSALLAR